MRFLVAHVGVAAREQGAAKAAAAILARLEKAWAEVSAGPRGCLKGRVALVVDCSGLYAWSAPVAGLAGLFTAADENFPLLIASSFLFGVSTLGRSALTRLFGDLPSQIQQCISISEGGPSQSATARKLAPLQRVPAVIGGDCRCARCETDLERERRAIARRRPTIFTSHERERRFLLPFRCLDGH